MCFPFAINKILGVALSALQVGVFYSQHRPQDKRNESYEFHHVFQVSWKPNAHMYINTHVQISLGDKCFP